VDIDDFKRINESDEYGELVGSQLLKEVGNRLKHTLRDEDIVSRLNGSDEFALAITSKTPKGTEHVAEKIRAAMLREFKIPGTLPINISVSIGLALQENHESIETLLSNAGNALEIAKQTKNAYHVYDDQTNLERRDYNSMVQAVLTAHKENQITPVFQPLYNLNGKIIGFERLSRMNYKGKPLSAEKFITILEDTGSIGEFNLAAVEDTCQLYLKELSTGNANTCFISVNLSPMDLQNSQLANKIKMFLADNGINPKNLDLEITERALLDSAESYKQLEELQAIGVTISLDDFGSSYSMLAQLPKFPFDRIKIDKSLLDAACSSDTCTDDNAKILKFAIRLGIELGKEIVIEGIEDEMKEDFIRKIIDEVLTDYDKADRPGLLATIALQGWAPHLGKPMPWEDARNRLTPLNP
jgi:diguanylate cyclase (GGDEF)-like protein